MMNIGKQDTLDEEMMAGYDYQIETPTVCQSYGLDIDEDVSNSEENREVTNTICTSGKKVLQHLNDEGTMRARPARTATRVSTVGIKTRPLLVRVTKFNHSENGLHGDVEEHVLSRDNEDHRCKQESDKSRPNCNSGGGS